MKMIVKCDYCGKDVEKNPSKIVGYDHHFCNIECSKQYRKLHQQNNYECDFCGKAIYLRPYQFKQTGKHYCSKACQLKGVTKFYSGENSTNFQQVIINCDWCDKEISRPPNQIQRNKNNFCSKDCARAYFAKVTSQTEETKQRSKQIALRNLSSGKIKTDSSIQLIIDELLKSMGVHYINEYVFKNKFVVDNYLPDYNLVIENQGEYWHSHPEKFPLLKYDTQLLRIKSDKAKHTYLYNHHNIEILYLWEGDINHNIQLCQKLIEKYIQSDGVLQNYESFNYHLHDGEIVLNSNIIIPYREYDISTLHKYVDTSIKEKPEYYITFKCEVCGKDKTQLKNRYDRHIHHFCSRECSAKGNGLFHESTIIKFSCDYCGKDCEQSRAQYDSHDKHFCSPKCRGLSVKDVVLMQCENCGKEIEVTAKERRLYKHHHCSYQCAVERQRKEKAKLNK